MPYTREIASARPTCLVVMIDQSKSMLAPFGNDPTRRKSQGVAEAINNILYNFVIRSSKGKTLKDYFSIGIIGYGGSVGPRFQGQFAGKELLTISELANATVRVDERERTNPDGSTEKFKAPVWIDPVGDGMTPMCQALTLAKSYVEKFITNAKHQDFFPPIVINITDGEPTDHNGDLNNVVNKALEIQALKTNDGNVLMFNAHVSSQAVTPVQFPSDENSLPDDYAKTLFKMSSVFPEPLLKRGRSEYQLTDGARGYVFNADMAAIVKFLDMGTKAAEEDYTEKEDYAEVEA